MVDGVTPMVLNEVQVGDRILQLGAELAEFEQTTITGRQAGMQLTCLA